MSLRPTPDPEVVPLLRAIKARIEGLGSAVSTLQKDGLDIFSRNKTSFLQLEVRRDHMSLELWLPAEQLDEARASGIARAHPFLGEEAVKVRFERAEDLSRVARWIEASFDYAPDRARKTARKKPTDKPVERTTPLISSLPPPPPRPSTLPAPAAAPAPAPEAPPPPVTARNGAVKPATRGATPPKNGLARPAEERAPRAAEKPAGPGPRSSGRRAAKPAKAATKKKPEPKGRAKAPAKVRPKSAKAPAKKGAAQRRSPRSRRAGATPGSK